MCFWGDFNNTPAEFSCCPKGEKSVGEKMHDNISVLLATVFSQCRLFTVTNVLKSDFTVS